jgi:hypothetical protein
MKDYLDERWRDILAHNGLADFDALWRHPADWFEPPNRRRGGWSGVSRCELALPDGRRTAIFLKRQENHGTPTLLHPLRGVPTYLREFQRIMAYRQAGIPTLVPVYFGMRRVGGDDRAILVTEELAGFVSLEDCVQRWLQEGAPPRRQRLAILGEVAALLRRMHAQRIQHSCFFPKHVFIRIDESEGEGGAIEARVIDLEKSRKRFSRTQCARRDLYSLNLMSQSWSASDRLWFFKAYLQIDKLTPHAKSLWTQIAARTAKKRRLGARPAPLVTRTG